MARSKKGKNLIYVLLGLVGLLAFFVLFVPTLTISASTPVWLENTITYATSFRDAFNVSGMVYMVILLGVLIAYLLLKYSKTRQNKDALKVVLAVVIAFAVYLLFTPALAAAFSDQVWLVDFSKLATDITEFIDTNNGFLTIIAGLGALTFFIVKKSK